MHQDTLIHSNRLGAHKPQRKIKAKPRNKGLILQIRGHGRAASMSEDEQAASVMPRLIGRGSGNVIAALV